MSPSLFEQIGHDKLLEVINTFYDKAFLDPIIGHFFFNVDKASLVSKQFAFTSFMLGGPNLYDGKKLTKAHSKLRINHAHFNRRQVMMKDVLDETDIPKKIKDLWLKKEQAFKKMIVNMHSSCTNVPKTNKNNDHS